MFCVTLRRMNKRLLPTKSGDPSPRSLSKPPPPPKPAEPTKPDRIQSIWSMPSVALAANASKSGVFEEFKSKDPTCPKFNIKLHPTHGDEKPGGGGVCEYVRLIPTAVYGSPPI